MHQGTDKTRTEEMTLNGVTYKAQFNGTRNALTAINKYKDKEVEFDDYLLQDVIVEPKGLSLDDFDDVGEAAAVIRWASRVLQGIFRNRKANTGSSEEAGGKE